MSDMGEGGGEEKSYSRSRYWWSATRKIWWGTHHAMKKIHRRFLRESEKLSKQ